MSQAPDRLKDLFSQHEVTGIDFIAVDPGQLFLDVYFLVPPASLTDPLTDAPGNPNPLNAKEKIRVYNPSGDVADKPVRSLEWKNINGTDFLRLTFGEAGAFSLYKLQIDDGRLDPYYNDVTFDFKANCPSDLDCKPPAHECPPDEWVDFPVDYQARDFWSLRRALLEFASLRYPHWPDRLEADAGIMITELLSALGDEMAYYQDRIGREAYLETATQRRSLRRHARLVDYSVHDGLGASAWLTVHASGTGLVDIPAGTDVFANGESGLTIQFEIGRQLAEALNGKKYVVDPALNELTPHIWDEDQACLPVGSTELYVKGSFEYTGGSGEGTLRFDDFPDNRPSGKWVLLQTEPASAAQPTRAHLVRLIKVKNATDPLFNLPITRLVWEQEQATPVEMDLTVLTVHGNLVPATAGATHKAWFFAGVDFSGLTNAETSALDQIQNLHFAVERTGANRSLTYLFTLPDSEKQLLVRSGRDPSSAMPEIYLEEMVFDGSDWTSRTPWNYRPALVGIHSASGEEPCFTLDDGAWRRVVGYRRAGAEIIYKDYASGSGTTIRFGDGTFGRVPKAGTVFQVHYRLGNGKWDNVAADTLQTFENIPGPAVTVTNALPANGGRDVETPDDVRQLAPEAFRAVTYRAVRPEDYAEAAERLPWVQRAGATFRWTGSWLSAFVTPDPRGTVVLEEERQQELTSHLNRFRQAGREVAVLTPVYANLDLEIDVCVESNAFAGDVKERVLQRLLGKRGVLPKPGYFAADRFTFGTPLRRATLEAAIQDVPGVKAVEEIRYRRRAWFDWQVFAGFEYDPGLNSIIRVENDPLHPERGSLKIYTHGGA